MCRACVCVCVCACGCVRVVCVWQISHVLRVHEYSYVRRVVAACASARDDMEVRMRALPLVGATLLPPSMSCVGAQLGR